MSFMLPSAQIGAPSLADVLRSCLAGLGVVGVENRLALRAARSTIIVLVDGLGASNISGAKAHCRYLAPHLTKSTTISTVFPSTTGAALASFVTGELPGTHGMLGYRIRDPESGALVNQLTGLREIKALENWLGAEPLYIAAEADGIRTTVVSHPRFLSTPLTTVIHKGATLVAARTIAERCDAAISAAKANRGLIVLYISELDELAHSQGASSHAWATKLEEVDAEMKRLASLVARDTSVILTADHGVLDIAQHHHVEYGNDEDLMAHITAIGGEPRCLQLFLADRRDAQEVVDRWKAHCGDSAFVATQSEMVDQGWFGDLTKDHRERLGDVFVLARKEVVFFDSRDPTNKARKMVGHHGGISSTEMKIPLLRLT